MGVPSGMDLLAATVTPSMGGRPLAARPVAFGEQHRVQAQ